MSTDASIFVRFREQIVPSRLWRAFSENGWGRDLDGSVSLLTPENFSRAEWDCLPDADLSRVADWFSELDLLTTPSYGFLLVHEGSEIGGHFFVRGREIQWSVNVNIPYHARLERVVDFGLCLEQVWPVLAAMNDPLLELRYLQILA